MRLLKLLVPAVVGAVFLLALSGSAHALSLSLQAAPPVITSVGQSVLVDLNVTGVKGLDGGGTLRGFDLLLEFDPSVLSLDPEDIALNLAPFGGNPSVIIDSSVLDGNSASLGIFVSLATLSDPALRLLQTDGFQLAQLSFLSLSASQTTISFGDPNDLTGLDGFSDPSSGARAHDFLDLLVAPEPSAALLFGLGLAGLAASGRARAR